MKLVSLIEWLRNRLPQVVRFCVGLLVLLVVLDGLVVDKQHAHTGLEKLPGFWSVFGFLGCVLIILGSKGFGHTGIMTREDYYDE